VIKAATLFGTRPEVIKLAPVVRALEAAGQFQVTNIASGQHTDLLYPFAERFGITIDEDLRVMEPGQTPSGVASRVLAALDPILSRERYDVLLVQGDTTTAMAGALAAFHRKVAVGHVEAGLRSGDVNSPFPEEMNRTLITRLASFHFAATGMNRDTLLHEGVPDHRIFVTGNPVVDSLREVLSRPAVSPEVDAVLEATDSTRRIVLTTHRRESFGEAMTGNLRVLARFVERRPDVSLIFPVHPNPVVVETARRVLEGRPRVHLIPPLPYEPFIRLLVGAWLIASDSGGVQEEAPTLGKPVVVLRENTERPEGVLAGVARLTDGDPHRLEGLLEEAYAPGSWADRAKEVENPFGRGDAGPRIAQALARTLSRGRRAASLAVPLR
jgi:UDP-N-acetylglucosamine 2-epimerase (non-hydrolysing)